MTETTVDLRRVNVNLFAEAVEEKLRQWSEEDRDGLLSDWYMSLDEATTDFTTRGTPEQVLRRLTTLAAYTAVIWDAVERDLPLRECPECGVWVREDDTLTDHGRCYDCQKRWQHGELGWQQESEEA